jgi:hypothetical protein
MKVARSDESVLILRDFPLGVGAVSVILAVVPLAAMIQDFVRGVGWRERAVPMGLATILALVVGAVFSKFSVFRFDRRRRVLVWRRRGLLRAEGGSVPFDAIRSAVVETVTDSSALQYRVALTTDGGSIPLTLYYSLGAGERCERLRDRINQFVGTEPLRHPDADIRAMASGGHSVRAVALAKQQLGLSTSEATRMIDEAARADGQDEMQG